MDLHFEQALKQITDFMKSEAKTETVIGDQFQLGEFTCVPVIKVGMGFGSGGGEDTATKASKSKKEGMGAGAGMGIEPMGFLVTREDNISFIETGKAHGLAAAIEKAPELIEKYAEHRKEREMA
ncbi:GerW family sporulation protein [Spongiivirga sp. MCCC 1A20706]|uniref:GerW family sporulation protein n=1 Tax=Spongiivirga sp. MCCC 1A20706 TaxID=3160963 RepID=UPI0039774B70